MDSVLFFTGEERERNVFLDLYLHWGKGRKAVVENCPVLQYMLSQMSMPVRLICQESPPLPPRPPGKPQLILEKQAILWSLSPLPSCLFFMILFAYIYSCQALSTCFTNNSLSLITTLEVLLLVPFYWRRNCGIESLPRSQLSHTRLNPVKLVPAHTANHQVIPLILFRFVSGTSSIWHSYLHIGDQ